MREIILMKPPSAPEPVKKRVAAYARVSKETERLENSLAAQVSYYSRLIQNNPNWEYAGVYIDRFVTGTLTKNRDGFNSLIADCDAGKIDIVLVKSIARFARKTLDLLNTVRHLRDIGVEVYFEKEDISSISSDGEFMLTVLASFAEEEIRNLSDNIKWTFIKKFEQGIPHHHFKIPGYEWRDDALVINADEADIVKRIYKDFISGSSIAEIERSLEHRFTYAVIRAVLLNETYTGTLIMQKYYISDPISKKCKANHGEIYQYAADENHDAIIDRDTFDRVQHEFKRRAELGAIANKFINTSCLTGKIKCGYCKSKYIRETTKRNGQPYKEWRCGMRRRGNAHRCAGRTVPERYIKETFSEVCGHEFDELLFDELIFEVIIVGADTIEYHFRNGEIAAAKWESTGNKDRWDAAARAEKSEYAKLHPFSSGKITCFTGKVQCGCCGNNFRRNHIKSTGRYSWGCPSGKRKCGIRWIREEELKRVAAEALSLSDFDEQIFNERINRMVILSNDELNIYFHDDTIETVPWNSKRVMEGRKCQDKSE